MSSLIPPNAANVEKHGVSLARTADLEILAVIENGRPEDKERRFRLYGLIDADAHCAVVTYGTENFARSACAGRTGWKGNVMGSRPKTDPENPEWTEADFAAAQGPETLPAGMLAAFPKTKPRGGRPPGSRKKAISIRLDVDVLEKFRATGPGWQSRINEALKRARV